MERSLNHKPFQILDQPCYPLSYRRTKNLKTSVHKVWDWDYWVQKSMWRQSKARDDWEPGLLNVLQPNSVFDGNVWLRQCKIKTNIWTHCALPREALTARTARTPGLRDSILLITRQLCLTCRNLKGGLQPNRDYHGKSTADFFQLAVPRIKPSVIRRVITERLTCI